MPKCKWKIKSTITEKAKKLSRDLGLSAITTQVLINRGLDSEETIKAFLDPSLSNLPDPFSLSDMKKAAERLADAIDKKEKICVYGDYDIDGSTSIAIIVNFLKGLGCQVKYYQPERFNEGYGIHVEAIKNIHKDGVTLLISVDCGTSSIDSAKYCKSIDLDLIITDHHKVGSELPDAYAFVNPHKHGEASVFSSLAGVGVAYYFIIATRKILRDRGYFKTQAEEPDLKNYLDIVAFGTIADVVPLMGINRTFVRKGLDIINSGSRVGLKALIEVSLLKTQINSDTLGYILAPRLNAAGRMGNASRSVELLLSDNEEEAKRLAKVLDEENQKRVIFQNKAWLQVQTVVEDMIAKGHSSFGKKHSLTFASEGWHQGVIGIVASKAVEKWYKPTAVFTIGENGLAKGSARSIPGVDIFSVFSVFKEIFEDFGGHDMAAGMSIKTGRIPQFEDLFEKGVDSYLKSKKIQPVIAVDVEVNVADITTKIVNEMSQLEPFGIDNPQPLFYSPDVKIFNKWVLKDKHLKLKLESGIDAIGFNMADVADRIGKTVDIVFKPSINEWNGNKTLQFVLVDAE